MSGWKAGDLALCVRGGQINGPFVLIDYPKAGKVYLVSRVGAVDFKGGVKAALWLSDGPANTRGAIVWAAHRFIKVTPPCDMKLVEEPVKVTADDAMRAAIGYGSCTVAERIMTMNETERQIVKWLRAGASKDESLALRTARLSNYTDAVRLARSSEVKWAISVAIERGEHRDKQDG